MVGRGVCERERGVYVLGRGVCVLVRGCVCEIALLWLAGVCVRERESTSSRQLVRMLISACSGRLKESPLDADSSGHSLQITEERNSKL